LNFDFRYSLELALPYRLRFAVVDACAEPMPGCKLTQLLGRGGFGEVWEGVGHDGAKMAFKFLPCRNHPGSVTVNEVRLLLSLRALKHPNVIELKNVVATANYVVIAMERADGNLLELLRAYNAETGTHIPPDHLCELLSQAAAALDFLAKQKLTGLGFGSTGLQHCDIKPTNLLIIGDQVKVADFGLCAPQMWNQSRLSAFGTPAYAPPELASGRVTERTDQFSLAVTYCELRTGRLPFKSNGFQKSDKPDLARFSERERLVLAKALDPKWLDRYASCTEFMTALQEAVRLSCPEPRKPSGIYQLPAVPA
jgi:serine/threonine protein kinase, bacterial